MAMVRAHHALNLEDAVASATTAFVLDGDERLLKILLRAQIVLGLTAEAFEEGLARSGATRDEAEAVREAFSESASRLSMAGDRLRRDLRQMVLMAAEAGAQPVLLTYAHPAVQDRAGMAVLVVARQLAVPLIDVAPQFAELLEHGELGQYFIPDLHPNDTGYGIVATRVRDRLLMLDAERVVAPAAEARIRRE